MRASWTEAARPASMMAIGLFAASLFAPPAHSVGEILSPTDGMAVNNGDVPINESVGQESSWDIKRILGTVPVEDDGSFWFQAPSNTPISIQPFDKDGQALALMRSWIVGMPGESISCNGCHEDLNYESYQKVYGVGFRVIVEK